MTRSQCGCRFPANQDKTRRSGILFNFCQARASIFLVSVFHLRFAQSQAGFVEWATNALLFRFLNYGSQRRGRGLKIRRLARCRLHFGGGDLELQAQHALLGLRSQRFAGRDFFLS